MKKTFKFFAAALAIVAAASCSKELANDNTDQGLEQELVHKVFSASLNVDDETKTTLHTDGVTVHWTEGDKIKVIPADTYKGNDFNVVSIDGTFADFEGETVDANSYRAVYPASAYHSNWSTSSTFTFSNGSDALKNQYAVENNFSIAAAFNSSSNFAVSTTSKDEHLYFQNINAYLKVSLEMDNAATIEVSTDKVEGTAGLSTMYDLGGTLNYRVSTGEVYMSSNHSIVFKSEDGSNLKSGVNYYIAIPAVKMTGLTLVVKDSNGGTLVSFKKAAEFIPVANTIYNLGTLSAPKLSVGDYYYSDGSTSAKLDNTKTVVGVVFYVGDPTEHDTTLKKDYPLCKNGLVLGLKEQKIQLATSSKWAIPDGYMDVVGCSYSGGKVHRLDPAASLMTGYNNTEVMCISQGETPSYGYLKEFPQVPNASSWYIPTIAEFDQMYNNLTVINNSLSAANAMTLIAASGTSYWTVCEEKGYNNYVAVYYFATGTLYESLKGYQTSIVRPIFAF